QKCSGIRRSYLGIKYLISLLSEGINLSLLCFLLLAETIINFNATLSLASYMHVPYQKID
ncbi:hypothetical protein, partial [Klebsiella pneumoniae]|uniref:hypothetical protein n=1 Tax=Klebsiella pneumoniae TaxID=573 RepID=UPI0019546517